MFGCYNCSVLRNEHIKDEIKRDIEKKAEELMEKAKAIGMQAQVTLTSK